MYTVITCCYSLSLQITEEGAAGWCACGISRGMYILMLGFTVTSAFVVISSFSLVVSITQTWSQPNKTEGGWNRDFIAGSVKFKRIPLI